MQGVKIVLLPFSFIYGVIIDIRNRLFDIGILKQTTFPVHTICVGNLAVGGAGKTPHVEYIIKLLLADNYKIATLSRGYKRLSTGYVLANDNSNTSDIGDEPLIFKSKYPIEVAVDKSRVAGVKRLMQQFNNINCVLLDDAFQHRWIKCGLNICVSDYSKPYFSDTLLPAGTLREFVSGIKRADIIIISKTPERTSPIDLRNFLKDIKPLAHQQVFFSYLKYGELYSITNSNEKIDTLNELFRYRVVSFAGIANAEPFVNYLKEYAALVSHLPFTDHHNYSVKDLEDIERYFRSFEGGNKILVTTEKDYMRLKNPNIWEIAKRMNIFVLPVEVTFKEKEQEFNELIKKYVTRNRIYHQKYSQ